MEGQLFLIELLREHELFPLTRPPGTLSPARSGGEGRGEGVRFMFTVQFSQEQVASHERCWSADFSPPERPTAGETVLRVKARAPSR